MEFDKYKEITKWLNDNFRTTDYLKDRITNDIARLFESLPPDYLIECTQNPNFIMVNDSDSKAPEGGIRRDLIINPFFYMILVLCMSNNLRTYYG